MMTLNHDAQLMTQWTSNRSLSLGWLLPGEQTGEHGFVLHNNTSG